MNTERLLKLADFLDALPEEKFSYGEWVAPCGTVACAGGWVALAFPEWGVEWTEDGLVGRTSTGHNALADAFGISQEQVFRLFVSGSSPTEIEEWPTAKDMAKRLRDFVEERS